MCGIIGYAGPRPCKDIILDGLEALEYRGYDSAGMVLVEDDRLSVVRRTGSVARLREIAGEPSDATLGMGHTRWATHGGVEDRNAHPFLSNDGRFAVLMNGIFENYVELRREVSEKGYELSSDTDTEALVHLIADVYDGDLVEAVRTVYPRLEGHFAFLVVALDQPDTIVAARLAWPPLVVGVGEGEMFIASFVPAFLTETRRVQHVQEGEIVELRPEGATFHPLAAGAPLLERAVEEVDASLEVAEMGGYETFMMKEITEQPTAIGATIGERIQAGRITLDGIGLTDAELVQIRRVLIVGCGTALHAGLVGRYLIEEWAGIATESDVASEWRYRNPVFDPDTLVLAISQSGETADTLAAMKLARERGARVVAITNIMGSAVTREAHGVLYTRAGLEIGVAATKTFTAQVVLLTLLALRLAELRHRMDAGRIATIVGEIERLPALVQEILDDDELHARVDQVAERFAQDRFFLFLGRHIGLPICLEGALKLKEISYIPTDAYPAGEMKHGPIALLGPDTPVVAVATDSHVYEKVVSNLQEVKARGAQVIAIASEGNEDIGHHAAYVIRVPRTLEELEPVLAVIPLQLLSYRIARRLGLDVDKPRNLAKTVTVE